MDFYHVTRPIEDIKRFTSHELLEWTGDYLRVLFGHEGFEKMVDINADGPPPGIDPGSRDPYVEPACYVIKGPGGRDRLQIGIETVSGKYQPLFAADFVGEPQVAWKAAHAVSDALREVIEAYAVPALVDFARRMFGRENVGTWMFHMKERLVVFTNGDVLFVESEPSMKVYLEHSLAPGPDNEYDWGPTLNDLETLFRRYSVGWFVMD